MMDIKNPELLRYLRSELRLSRVATDCQRHGIWRRSVVADRVSDQCASSRHSLELLARSVLGGFRRVDAGLGYVDADQLVPGGGQ